MNPLRKAGRVLGGVLLVYALLVATHLGEFWPFSIYPMFSQGGQPWSRAVVREVPRETSTFGWGTYSSASLPGVAYPLLEYGIDPIDLANFVSKTRNWDEPRLAALRRMFYPDGEVTRPLLVFRVDGSITDDDSVVVAYRPYVLITPDSVVGSPALSSLDSSR